MTRLAVIFLTVAAGTTWTAPPAAAIDFGLGLLKKKAKAEPPSRVKQLIAALQADPDEKARLTAAEGLRSFEPRDNPDMLPALIRSVQQDPSPAVRAAAAETLGRLKPVEQPVGLALEAVQESDPSPAVREAAKSALWQYHLNGYRPPVNAVANQRQQTPEPPLASRPTTVTAAKPATGDPATAGFRPISNGLGRAASFHQTTEPPLAKPKSVMMSAPPAPAPAPQHPTAEVPGIPTPMPSVADLPAYTLPPPPTLTPPPGR